MTGQKAEKQFKHLDIAEGTESVRTAKDRLQQLSDRITGAKNPPEKTSKEPISEPTLAGILNNTHSVLHDLSSEMISLMEGIENNLF